MRTRRARDHEQVFTMNKSDDNFGNRESAIPGAATFLDYVLLGLWTFCYAVLTRTFRLLKRVEAREGSRRTVSTSVAGRGARRKTGAPS